MNNPEYLRFVHYQAEGGKYNGITIGYSRTTDNVFFSYSLCVLSDTYEKSIGRRINTDNYLTHIDNIHQNVSYVDNTKRVGCLSIEDVRHILRNSSISRVLADHVINNITFMDLKHSEISHLLTQFVLNEM